MSDGCHANAGRASHRMESGLRVVGRPDRFLLAPFPRRQYTERSSIEQTRARRAMMQPITDRNVLLGVLAVQLNLVTPESLATARRDWERDPPRSLGQVLVARGL